MYYIVLGEFAGLFYSPVNWESFNEQVRIISYLHFKYTFSSLSLFVLTGTEQRNIVRRDVFLIQVTMGLPVICFYKALDVILGYLALYFRKQRAKQACLHAHFDSIPDF